ncbi:MAG: PEP-CTERM sorting domain-containing protein [candidate division Zixibacteria bacterium]|jgi:hypothetical protein|nr:PEP-CTERM sorting domain-containing protein [candidate division Zixibacteria bacterium]
MKGKIIITLVAFLLLAVSQVYALPSLTINGTLMDPLRDADDNVVMSFDHGQQTWTLMAEFAGWHAKNNFGFYTDPNDPTIIFPGSASPVVDATTSISAGTEFGLYMWADLDRPNGDPILYSHKQYTTGTGDNDYQYFYVYDVRAYRGLGYSYDFDTDHEDFSTVGNYDYLIYVDDSGAGPDYDHNDMVLGVSAVPEPGTLILLGIGLATGAGIVRRRKS